MIKDRLCELEKVQNGKSKDVTIEVDTDTQGESDKKELRKTFERAEVFTQWLESMEENEKNINIYLHKLDSNINQKDIADKLQDLFQNNTSISHRINTKLKAFEEELKSTNSETAEGRIKKIQYTTLRARYINIFKRNNEALEKYKTIQKNHLDGQLRAKGIRTTDEELESLLQNQTDIQLFTDNIIAETREAKRALADIEERHQQLLKIERMLVEVRDLFLQMAILIDEQQDLVDRIEYQAQLAKEHVGKVPKLTQEAATKKIKYLKCKIYTGIVVAVLILILLVSLFR